jgi:hypothetical protein
MKFIWVTWLACLDCSGFDGTLSFYAIPIAHICNDGRLALLYIVYTTGLFISSYSSFHFPICVTRDEGAGGV